MIAKHCGAISNYPDEFTPKKEATMVPLSNIGCPTALIVLLVRCGNLLRRLRPTASECYQTLDACSINCRLAPVGSLQQALLPRLEFAPSAHCCLSKSLQRNRVLRRRSVLPVPETSGRKISRSQHREADRGASVCKKLGPTLRCTWQEGRL